MLKSPLGPGCKMSLMPLRQSNGLVAVDVGYYYTMSRPGQNINFECVRSKEQGGFTHVGMWSNRSIVSPIESTENANHGHLGTTRSLILAFYAPDSPFDEAVQQWLENDQASCQDTATTPGPANRPSLHLMAADCRRLLSMAQISST